MGPGAPIVSPNKINFLRPIGGRTRAILPAIGVDIFYRAPPVRARIGGGGDWRAVLTLGHAVAQFMWRGCDVIDFRP